MNGAIGVAKYVATEERLKRLQDLQREQKKVEQEVLRAEQSLAQVLRDEEAVCASHARRLQTTAETKDSLQRMQRNPGVSFVGYKSPARRRISEMEKAILEHARAANVAQERYKLARSAGNRARERLALRRTIYNNWLLEHQFGCDPRHLDITILEVQKTLKDLKQTINEAEIDEAVMHNRVPIKDAAHVRKALRNLQPNDLER